MEQQIQDTEQLVSFFKDKVWSTITPTLDGVPQDQRDIVWKTSLTRFIKAVDAGAMPPQSSGQQAASMLERAALDYKNELAAKTRAAGPAGAAHVLTNTITNIAVPGAAIADTLPDIGQKIDEGQSTLSAIGNTIKENPGKTALSVLDLAVSPLGGKLTGSLLTGAAKPIIKPIARSKIFKKVFGPVQLESEALMHATNFYLTGDVYTQANMRGLGTLIERELAERSKLPGAVPHLTTVGYMSPQEFVEATDVIKQIGQLDPRKLKDHNLIKQFVKKTADSITNRAAKAGTIASSKLTGLDKAIDIVWDEEKIWRPYGTINQGSQARQTAFSSQQAPIRNFEKLLVEAGVMPTETTAIGDIYKWMQSGHPHLVQEFDDHVIKSFNNNVAHVLEKRKVYSEEGTVKFLNDLSDYARAKDLTARQRAIQQTTGSPHLHKRPGGPSIGSKKAQLIVKRAKAMGLDRDYDNLLEMIYDGNSKALDIQVKYGLVSKEAAEEWRKKFGRTWIPYRDNRNPGLNAEFKAEGFMPSESQNKLATGRYTDPHNTILMSLHYQRMAVSIGVRNRATQDLAKLIEYAHDPNIAKIFPARMMDVESKQLFNTVDKGLKPNQLRYFDNGEERIIEFNEEFTPLVSAIRQTNADISGGLIIGSKAISDSIKALGYINRAAAANATKYSTVFGPFNAWRDALQAVGMAHGEIGGTIGLEISKNIPKAWMAYLGKGDKTFIDAARRFRIGGYQDFYKVQKTVNSMQELVIEDIGKLIHGDSSALKRVDQFFSSYNGLLETGTRLAVFKTLLDRGIPEVLSMRYAREITLDFLDKGTYGKVLNSLWLFSTANIKGAERFALSLKNPHMRQTMLDLVIASFYHHEISRYISGTDENGINYMDRALEYKKDTNLLFGLPGAEPISIPAPRAFIVPWRLGQLISEMLHKDETGMSAGLMGLKMTSTTLSAFMPIGQLPTNVDENWVSNVAGAVAPSTLFWAAGPFTGTGPFGDKLYPEGLESTGWDFQNTHAGTNKAYKDVANLLFHLGADISPETIRHLFANNPAIPSAIKEVVSAGLNYYNEDPVSNLPGIRRFTQKEGSSTSGIFYRASQDVSKAGEKVKQLMENGMHEEAFAFIEENSQALFGYKKGMTTKLGEVKEYISEKKKIINHPDYTRYPLSLRKEYARMITMKRDQFLQMYTGLTGKSPPQ